MTKSQDIGCRPIAALAMAWMLTLPVQALAQSQQMLVPAYFAPGSLWTQMDSGAPTVGIAIVNPDSGPGAEKDAGIAAAVAQAQASGLTVIGYDYTNYGKRPLADVMKDARRYVSWYNVNGIFYDEAANTKPQLPYYKDCYAFAKSLGANFKVVINPGTQTIQGYMSACDIVCTFESVYSDYENTYSAPAWVANYPASRFCHIVYNVATDAEMKTVIAQTKKRNAGWVFVTSLTLPNPYDNLPVDPYWSDELAALAGSE